MTSILQQTALLPAGCQPWNLNMVASSGSNFVYCATLAVYIYEVSYNLLNVTLVGLNANLIKLKLDKTLTCFKF